MFSPSLQVSLQKLHRYATTPNFLCKNYRATAQVLYKALCFLEKKYQLSDSKAKTFVINDSKLLILYHLYLVTSADQISQLERTKWVNNTYNFYMHVWGIFEECLSQELISVKDLEARREELDKVDNLVPAQKNSSFFPILVELQVALDMMAEYKFELFLHQYKAFSHAIVSPLAADTLKKELSQETSLQHNVLGSMPLSKFLDEGSQADELYASYIRTLACLFLFNNKANTLFHCFRAMFTMLEANSLIPALLKQGSESDPQKKFFNATLQSENIKPLLRSQKNSFLRMKKILDSSPYLIHNYFDKEMKFDHCHKELRIEFMRELAKEHAIERAEYYSTEFPTEYIKEFPGVYCMKFMQGYPKAFPQDYKRRYDAYYRKEMESGSAYDFIDRAIHGPRRQKFINSFNCFCACLEEAVNKAGWF